MRTSYYLKLGKLWMRVWGHKVAVRAHDRAAAGNGLHAVTSILGW